MLHRWLAHFWTYLCSGPWSPRLVHERKLLATAEVSLPTSRHRLRLKEFLSALAWVTVQGSELLVRGADRQRFRGTLARTSAAWASSTTHLWYLGWSGYFFRR